MDALRRISEDHNNLWRLFTTVDHALAEASSAAALDGAFFRAALDYVEQFVERLHHRREEELLFPLLRARCPQDTASLDALHAEHASGPQRLSQLRADVEATLAGRATLGDLRAAMAAYTLGLKNHILREEREILPLARAQFNADDWAQVNAAFANHADPVFGEQVQAEFRQLLHQVVSLAPEGLGLGAHDVGQIEPKRTPDGRSALLKIEQLSSAYGRIRALDGVSLEVHAGETVALVGANGAGKTTLLRTLSGLQPARGGRIVFDGEDLSALRADLRVRRGIAHSPEGRQVFGPLSIEDNLRLGAYTVRNPAHIAADLERVWAMFPILHEKRALPAGTLSGGQQQMLAIARALMSRPRLLLLDEPSMGLAPLLVQEVFEVIRSLQAQGMTILLVEQNALAALDVAHRGYVLETGRITLSGTGADLIRNEQVRAAYLGM